MNRARIVLLASTCWLLACGGEPPPPARVPVPAAPKPPPPVATETAVTPDAPFRKGAPGPDGRVTFTPPVIRETRLKNGVRVLLSERHELPIVSVRLMIAAGAGDLPDTRPGAMSFLGAMMEQGTKKRSALAISDEYEALGAGHGAWADWDSTGVSIKVLADKVDAALEIMADVALAPTFPDAEIERVRTRRIASIQSEKSSPGTIAQNALAAALFGRAHPYGHSLTGEEVDAKKVTRAELVRAYEKLYVPENATLVVAGDVTESSILPRLEAAFGGWKKRGAAFKAQTPKTPAKAATPKRVVFVDRPGAQSQVQLMRPGVPFGHPDRDRIVVTNAILGGMFSSRVNMNLREKNSYTYGARSYFAMRHGAGPFLVGAAVFADKTGPAIKEIMNELEGLRNDGPTADELALAKESIRMAMPGRFETSSDVASAIGDLVTYGLPLDEYEKRSARIDAVTAADVKRVASELLASSAMTVVVVGDKATVLPQLEPLGLGPIDERDPWGNEKSAKVEVIMRDVKGPPAKPPTKKN